MNILHTFETRADVSFLTLSIFCITCTLLTFSCDGGSRGSTNELMQGSAKLLITTPIPEETRTLALSRRADIEAMNYTMAEDGSAIAFPDIIPAGWLVTLGDETALIDADGNFEIEVVTGGASEGEILHPAEDQLAARFSVDQLVASGSTPTPIVIYQELLGGCCMTEGDSCCPSNSTPKSLQQQEETITAVLREKFSFENISLLKNSTKKLYPTEPALRTYPTFNWGFCLLTDGPLTSVDPLLGYFGSTCSTRVDQGCCTNEGGSFLEGGLIALGVLTRISCVNNHKGRYCQELTPGDLTVSTEGENSVELGETLLVTVHNNACYGRTYVADNRSLGGQLTGDNYQGITIKHYTGTTGSYSYSTDQFMHYEAPACISDAELAEGIEDRFLFNADSAFVVSHFVLAKINLWRFNSGGQIFSRNRAGSDGFRISDPEEPNPDIPGSGCDSYHVHGSHPCTGGADPDPTGCGHGRVTQIAQ